MSDLHQCPSSLKNGLKAEPTRAARLALGAGTPGQSYWRGLEEAADTPEFREGLQREFPAGAGELLQGGRRTFLKLMGAGLALAGVAAIPGCRRPDHKILAYSRTNPEDVIPGRPVYYATAMPLPGGGCEGLLVETHEGRPTKIEGNPLHPINQGKSTLWSQASILSLYDPDRTKSPVRVTEPSGQRGEGAPGAGERLVSWAEAEREIGIALAGLSGDKKLVVVVGRGSGPTREALRAELAAKFKDRLLWAVHDSIDSSAVVQASIAAFGDPAAGREVVDLSGAKVVVSLDRDFMQLEAGSPKLAREVANARRVTRVGDAMLRLYAVEPAFSLTGAMADHRLRVAPSQVGAFAVALGRAVLAGGGLAGGPWADLKRALDAVPGTIGADAAKFASAVAADLLAPGNRGASYVTAGLSQPAWVHALVHAINGALGNIGKTVTVLPWGSDDRAAMGGSMALACRAMLAGEVAAAFVIGCNPAFDAPADLEFVKAFMTVPARVVMGLEGDETAALATLRLPMATYLEAWGDAVAYDGTLSVVQPVIAPLYDGRSEIELLGLLARGKAQPGYELVREVWKARLGWGAEFDKKWTLCLHNGLAEAAGAARPQPRSPEVLAGAVAELVGKAKLPAAPSSASLEVVFAAGPMRDGRWNNNAWLQEAPDPFSKIVWDNAALVSPATAAALGVMQTPETRKKPSGRMATIRVNGREVTMVCWAVPGVAEGTVVLPLGYGRSRVGLVGQGTGFDVNPLRTSGAMWHATGATLTPTGGGERYNVAVTQSHSSMEGRALVREMDLQAWNDPKVHEKVGERRDSYNRKYSDYMDHTLAERLAGSEFNHMPAPRSVYQNPYSDRASGYRSSHSHTASPTGTGRAAFDYGPQWAMTIDQSVCTGCNVCTIACQAENNIPVVGKVETQKGREMHWIRVDRYFKGHDENDPEGTVFQPVACVHCENAPCETVCPVNATVHGPEGHNYMVYNRCIGTRYCANNCPWKVRRFNFFDYGVTKFNGSYFGQETLEGLIPDWAASSTKTPHRLNPNLIPPRLREKLDEISRMQKNPNVTVRSRGVMEKCTFCVQRTNEAKISMKLEMNRRDAAGERKDKDGRPLPPWRPEDGWPDGIVQTACQQACPTNAIAFGNMLDKDAAVSKWRSHDRSYLLLGYLGTRPRTSHLVRVNNPNPALRDPVLEPFDHHGGGGHGDKKHAAFVDTDKQGRDGYILSLGVLTGDRA